MALALEAHVGSPDVFFSGRAGAYDIRVVIRPPEVVPGVARVTVRVPAEVRGVSIRPVYWRAGSKGAPSADEMRRIASSQAGTFEGSLWLMARGAYSVDVIVDGSLGRASVLVPVASIATGRLDMNPALAVLLVVLGVVLCAGLVNIVYKGAGESLLPADDSLDRKQKWRARRVAAVAVPVLALAVFGGARWWSDVDSAYQRTIYRPSPLLLDLRQDSLFVQLSDTLWQPPRRPSALVSDHGKLMHFFLVKAGDAAAFAHLHPVALDSSPIPRFVTRVPALPAGKYHVYGDVVHETGFERTLVGTVTLPGSAAATPSIPMPTGRGRRSRRWRAPVVPASDGDDAWFIGNATRERTTRLSDGSAMELTLLPNGVITAGAEETIRVFVSDPRGEPARLEPYLGMSAHAVVTRADGSVYVHLHPMGTVTAAAQEAFLARDRGDTTADGALRLMTHDMHASLPAPIEPQAASTIEFPYAFPRSGNYRLFIQVKRAGRVLTGAFTVTVADAAPGATRAR